MNCGVGRRHNSDLAWLWLWHRPAATAPIQPLAWEPPHATGVALKRPKKKKFRNVFVEEYVFRFIKCGTINFIILFGKYYLLEVEDGGQR